MVNLIGQTLGQYRIIEQIGEGGMATVYKAYQPSLDRYVAVKVLPPYFAHEPGFTERFIREAKAIAKLNHPNILPIYDFGQEGEFSYIVMKYVEAGTLKDIMGQPLALDVTADILRQIAGALDHAHQRGILHRDVKPGNVLLDEGHWVLLTDFGLAKMVEGSAVLTASGVGVGTPAYMAPEQGRGEQVDARADIYSLGVVLYEMLTGKVPFEAETPMAVVIKHITDPLPLPRSVNPKMPDAVERVILRALAKGPDDRFASAQEMADALTTAVVAAMEPALETIEIPVAELLPAPLPPVSGPVVSKVEPPAVSPTEPPTVSPAESPVPAQELPTPIPTPMTSAAEVPVPIRKGIPWKILGGVAGLIVLVLAAAFVLGNLGRGEEATPTAAVVARKEATATRPVPTATPKREPTPSPKPPRPGEELREGRGEIVLWHMHRPGAEEEVLIHLIERAQAASPGLTVRVERIPLAEIFARYWEEASAGSGPDVFVAPNDELGHMAHDGLVLNLDPYLAGKLDGVSEVGIEGMKVDGRLYGVPASAKAVALYYNKSWTDAPPATTDELLEAVRGGAPMTFVLGSYHLFGWSGAFGGQLLDPDGRCIADRGGWVEALEYLLALQEAGAIFEPDYGAAEAPFRAGEAAFFVNGPWALEDYKDALGENLSVAPLPVGPGGPANPIVGIDGFYVNPNSRNVQAAVDLALFLTSQESAQFWADGASRVPARSDVWPADPSVALFMEISTAGLQQLQDPKLASYWDWELFDHVFREVLGGHITPADGVAEACAVMNAVPCKDELGCVEVLPDEPILIAYMLDKSGPTRSIGLDSLHGIEMAIDEKMEILGHPVELTGEDSGCDSEIGAEVASAIVADSSILAIIGTTCSTTAWKAAPVISEAGLVMISPSSSTSLLTAPERHSPGFLRVTPSDRELGVMAAQFAWEMLGVKTAATLYDGVHSDTLQQWFAETFKELGGEITAQAEIQPDEAHIHSTLAFIAQTKPGFVFYALSVETGGFVTRLARETAGLKEIPLMSAEGMFSSRLLEIAGPAADGLYLSAPALPAMNKRYRDFLGRYQEMYGELPQTIFVVRSCDATMMILAAIERVAVQTDDGTLYIGRQALRDALFATRDFEGLTGNLTCTPHGDCAGDGIAVYQIVSADPDSWRPGSNPVKVWPERP